MHKTLNMLSDRLCKDIEESSREEKLTPATLEMLDKAVDIIKDIKTIEAMEEYGDEGYSEGRYPRNMSRGDSYGSYNSYGSYGNNYRNSRGNDDVMRRMETMNDRDRQRLEEFMRQM
jgi:hypothetical protein